MAMKIRLARGGSKKRPHYSIVAADSRSPRDGRFIEKLGTYDPLLAKDNEGRVKINLERVQYWLGQGAQATDRVARFLEAAGVTEKKARSNPKAGQPGKAALERAKARADKAAAPRTPRRSKPAAMADPRRVDPGLTCVGAIAGGFGVQGEVRLKSFCADPAAIAGYAPLVTEDGRSFGVRITRPIPGAFAARLTGVATREEAEALKGTRLYAPRDRLPPLGDDEYYHADLIGLAVVDTGGAPLGTVRAVLDHGAGDILEIAAPATPTFSSPSPAPPSRRWISPPAASSPTRRTA